MSTGAITGDLSEGNGRGSVGPRAGRTRDALVVAQVAVAIVLLVGAGLLLRSFSALTRVDTGIDTKNLLTFDMALSGARAELQRTQVAFYDETLKALRSLPGVRGAGAAVTLPIGGDDFLRGLCRRRPAGGARGSGARRRLSGGHPRILRDDGNSACVGS